MIVDVGVPAAVSVRAPPVADPPIGLPPPRMRPGMLVSRSMNALSPGPG